jgi:xylulose-5-phosphate/fructose-6-phosphate phosphoketolase
MLFEQDSCLLAGLATTLRSAWIYMQDQPPCSPTPLEAGSMVEDTGILGHWGASPGLSFAYIHLNRLIKNTTST